jgi:hypothetical protein
MPFAVTAMESPLNESASNLTAFSMQTDHFELMSFVLEASESLPLVRRVKVIRGLANLCGDPQEQASLLALAEQLKRSDELCREFNFSFIQKHKDSHNVKTSKNGR